ncbi:hypothetical protein XENOCAPTIV_000402, partial [Xenoophorus captivus]
MRRELTAPLPELSWGQLDVDSSASQVPGLQAAIGLLATNKEIPSPDPRGNCLGIRMFCLVGSL